MLPMIMTALRSYAPIITLPFAALIGLIGYNIECRFDRTTPAPLVGVKDMREERRLRDSSDALNEGQLKEKRFVPLTVFETNVSPSLVKKTTDVVV